jgi:hypothetical protein
MLPVTAVPGSPPDGLDALSDGFGSAVFGADAVGESDALGDPPPSVLLVHAAKENASAIASDIAKVRFFIVFPSFLILRFPF